MNHSSARYTSGDQDYESGAILLEFTIVVLLIVFIVFGTLVISNAIHYNLKVVQVARLVSKLTFRRCETELRTDRDNANGTLQPCIANAAQEALALGQSVVPDIKIWISVFASTHTPPGAAFPSSMLIGARVSEASAGATVATVDTEYPTALDGLTAFHGLLDQTAVATVVEVIAPDLTNSLPFKDWILPAGKARREKVVF